MHFVVDFHVYVVTVHWYSSPCFMGAIWWCLRSDGGSDRALSDCVCKPLLSECGPFLQWAGGTAGAPAPLKREQSKTKTWALLHWVFLYEFPGQPHLVWDIFPCFKESFTQAGSEVSGTNARCGFLVLADVIVRHSPFTCHSSEKLFYISFH